MPEHQLIFPFYQIVILLLGGAIIFVAANVGGTYLKIKVEEKMRPPKPSVHGSLETCGQCIALVAVKTDIPDIRKKQSDFRDVTLPAIQRDLASIKTTLAKLEPEVIKIFGMIEDDWKEKIKELRQQVASKDNEINRLKNV